MRAIKTLLRGAVPKHIAPNEHIYVKSGGFARAVEDFESVKLNEVSDELVCSCLHILNHFHLD